MALGRERDPNRQGKTGDMHLIAGGRDKRDRYKRRPPRQQSTGHSDVAAGLVPTEFSVRLRGRGGPLRDQAQVDPQDP
jgi:hypothetical protein